MLPSKTLAIYAPTSSTVWKCLLPHTLANAGYCHSFHVTQFDRQLMHLIILICISLITDEIKPLKMFVAFFFFLLIFYSHLSLVCCWDVHHFHFKRSSCIGDVCLYTRHNSGYFKILNQWILTTTLWGVCLNNLNLQMRKLRHKEVN